MAYIYDGTNCKCKFTYDETLLPDNQGQVDNLERWDTDTGSWIEVDQASSYGANFDLWAGGNMNVSNLDSRKVQCKHPNSGTTFEQTIFCDEDQPGVPGCEICEAYPTMYDDKGHCYPHIQVPAWQYYENITTETTNAWNPYESGSPIQTKPGQYGGTPKISAQAFCRGPEEMHGTNGATDTICDICETINDGAMDLMGAFDFTPTSLCSQTRPLGDAYPPDGDFIAGGNVSGGVGERIQVIRQYCYNSADFENENQYQAFGQYSWSYPDASGPVFGCTDPSANNYNPSADTDDGFCDYDLDNDGVPDVDEIDGCTDPTAANYNPLATEDNGSCIDAILGCMYSGEVGDEDLEDSDSGISFGHGGITSSDYTVPSPYTENTPACNYNPNANVDDGSCVWPEEFCQGYDLDPTLCDVDQDGIVIFVDYYCPLIDAHDVVIPAMYSGAPAASVPEGFLPYPSSGLDNNESGCTDLDAFNYDGTFNFSDNSQCNYCPDGYTDMFLEASVEYDGFNSESVYGLSQIPGFAGGDPTTVGGSTLGETRCLLSTEYLALQQLFFVTSATGYTLWDYIILGNGSPTSQFELTLGISDINMSNMPPSVVPETFAGYLNVTGIKVDSTGGSPIPTELGQLILQPDTANSWNLLTHLYDITLINLGIQEVNGLLQLGQQGRLHSLNLSYNNISSFNDILDINTPNQIHSIDLSHNNISGIIPSTVFQKQYPSPMITDGENLNPFGFNVRQYQFIINDNNIAGNLPETICGNINNSETILNGGNTDEFSKGMLNINNNELCVSIDFPEAVPECIQLAVESGTNWNETLQMDWVNQSNLEQCSTPCPLGSTSVDSEYLFESGFEVAAGIVPNTYGDYCLSLDDMNILGALKTNSMLQQTFLYTENDQEQYITPADTIYDIVLNQWVSNSNGVLRLNRIASYGNKKISGPLPAEISISQNDSEGVTDEEAIIDIQPRLKHIELPNHYITSIDEVNWAHFRETGADINTFINQGLMLNTLDLSDNILGGYIPSTENSFTYGTPDGSINNFYLVLHHLLINWGFGGVQLTSRLKLYGNTLCPDGGAFGDELSTYKFLPYDENGELAFGLDDVYREELKNWVEINLTHYEQVGTDFFTNNDSNGNPLPQNITNCEIFGCISPAAQNFNPLATTDPTSACIFDGYLHFPWTEYADGGFDAEGKTGTFGANLTLIDMIRVLHSPSGCGFADTCPEDIDGNSLGYQYNKLSDLDTDEDGIVSYDPDALAFSSDAIVTISNPNENCIPNNPSTAAGDQNSNYCLGDARPYEFLKRIYAEIDAGFPSYQFVTTYFPLGGADVSMQNIQYFEDYDINEDFNIDITDAQLWRSIGRHDIAVLINLMINLEIDTPLARSESDFSEFADELMVSMSYSKQFYSENQIVSTTPDGENIFSPVYEGFEQITRTSVTQVPYFGANNSSIKGSDIFTASMSDSNKLYYFGVTDGNPHSSKSDTQFYVAFGHYAGSGSDTHNGNRKGPSEAVYKQYIAALSDYNNTDQGFIISSGSAGNLEVQRDKWIYVLNFKQSKFKDQLQVGNWTLSLSGSINGPGKTLKLTDNSAISTIPPIQTPAGRQYNIVSGSAGNTTARGGVGNTFGFFYPDVGIMVLGEKVSMELRSGSAGNGTISPTPAFNSEAKGNNQLYPNTSSVAHSDNALLLINAMNRVNGPALTINGEKETTDKYYACRISPGEFNFTNNPSILSGSGRTMISPEPGRINEFPVTHSYTGKDGISYTQGDLTMGGNPNTFVTQVSLFNQYGTCVATAKLNKPLRNDTTRELVIKVKLSY